MHHYNTQKQEANIASRQHSKAQCHTNRCADFVLLLLCHFRFPCESNKTPFDSLQKMSMSSAPATNSGKSKVVKPKHPPLRASPNKAGISTSTSARSAVHKVTNKSAAKVIHNKVSGLYVVRERISFGLILKQSNPPLTVL